jgi:hypothetical protein
MAGTATISYITIDGVTLIGQVVDSTRSLQVTVTGKTVTPVINISGLGTTTSKVTPFDGNIDLVIDGDSLGQLIITKNDFEILNLDTYSVPYLYTVAVNLGDSVKVQFSPFL